MTKMLKRLISVILVLSMVLGSSVMVFADGTQSEQLKYVAIGDSFSSGYGFDTFYGEDAEETYSQLFAEYLNAEYNRDMLIAGIRSTDVYYMLDKDFNREDGYIKNFMQVRGRTAGQYEDVIKDADIVSIKLGYNNYFNAFMPIISNDLSVTKDKYITNFGTDFSEILTESEQNLAEDIYNKLLAIIDSELDPTIVAEWKAAFGSVLNYKISENAEHTLGDYISYLSYSVAAGIRDFDNVLAEIYNANKDAEVYVLQLSNPLQDFEIVYQTVSGKSIEIPLGDMLGKAFDIFNLYYALESSFSNQLIFVADDSTPETFVSLADKDLSFAETFLKTLNLGFSDDEITTCAENLKKYAGLNSVDLKNFILTFSDFEVGLSGQDLSTTIKSYLTEYKNDSEGAKLLVFYYLNSLCLNGYGSHPTAGEHERVAQLLEDAYEENQSRVNANTAISNLQAAYAGGLTVPVATVKAINSLNCTQTSGNTQKNTNQINYVSFGDSHSMPYGLCSMQVDGVDTWGFRFDDEDTNRLSWCSMFADELATTTGKTVNWNNYALAGSRWEELNILLNYANSDMTTRKKYYIDEYSKGMFINGMFESISDLYDKSSDAYDVNSTLINMSTEVRESVKNADIISIELGGNSYGGTLFYALYGQRVSLSIEDLLDFLGVDINISSIRQDFKSAINYSSYTSSQREEINKIVDYMLYEYVSYVYSIESSLQSIYEMNDNAEVYVTGRINPIENLSAQLEDGGVSLPIGKLVDIFYDLIDTYCGMLCSYSDRYHFVDFENDDIDYLWNAMQRTDLSEYDIYYYKQLLESQYDYTLTDANKNTVLSKLAKAVQSCNNTIALYEIDASVEDIRAYLNGTLADATKQKSIEQIIARDLVIYYDAAGVHCSYYGQQLKADAMFESYEMVQKTGVTAREYCIYDALGLYDLRDEMQSSIDKISSASSAIANKYESLASSVKSSDASTYNSLVYGNWSDVNDKINDCITSLSAIGPLSSVLANAIKISKNTVNVGLLFATYIYENGGYASIDNGSTATVISGGDASYSAALKDALALSDEPIVVNANGDQTASQLVGDAKSDLYIVDVDAWDVKNNSSDVSKFITENVVSAYKKKISKNAELLYKCGFANAKNVAAEISEIVTDVSTKMNSISGALAIEDAAHKNNQNAIVAYLGRVEGDCELERISNDITNMSLFTSAMFTDNTVYIDRQESADTVKQIKKHLTTETKERDYSDNIKSVVLNNLNDKADSAESLNQSVQTVTTTLTDVLEKFPITQQLVQDKVDEIKEESIKQYESMKQTVQDAVKNILNIFKK